MLRWVVYVSDVDLYLSSGGDINYNFLGAAISEGDTEQENLLPGTTKKRVEFVEGYVWNKNLLNYEARPPKNEYEVKLFLNTFFTTEQVRNFLLSDDVEVQRLVNILNNYKIQEVPLHRDSAVLSNMLDILVSKNIIDQQTKDDAIL